jgi:DNA-binding transcriptional LysR family regulator
MELDPRRLRVLRAVTLRGGVVDAARLLHLTPSAVSQQLAQLEHEAGLPLVDRSRRRVGLTAAGQLLAARAERIEQELAEARRELAELSGRVSGPVMIAAFPTAICHLLVPTLQALSRTHPELRPRVLELEGPKVLHELRTGGVDLVIAEHDADGPDPAPQHHSLFADRVADDDYRILTPAGWPAHPGSIRDLAAQPWVASPPAAPAAGRWTASPRSTASPPNAPTPAWSSPPFSPWWRPASAPRSCPRWHWGTPHPTRSLPLPVAGQRRITALRRASRSGPEPVADALVRGLQDTARELALSSG